MENAKWISTVTDATPGIEQTKATLHLFHFGALVPVLQISSLGVLRVRTNGAWQEVLTVAALPINAITTDG
jgi:hypothetical protein